MSKSKVTILTAGIALAIALGWRSHYQAEARRLQAPTI